jgi:hypothetical protein
MVRSIFKAACLLLSLVALSCDAKPPAPPAGANTGAARAVLVCPVCTTEFPRDRSVPVADVLVCSQGCAIRYELSKLPPPAPQSRASEIPASQPEEEDR